MEFKLSKIALIFFCAFYPVLATFAATPEEIAQQISKINSIDDLVKFTQEQDPSIFREEKQEANKYALYEKFYSYLPSKNKELAAYSIQFSSTYQNWFDNLDYAGMLNDFRIWSHATVVHDEKIDYIVVSKLPAKIDSVYSFTHRWMSGYEAEDLRSYVFFRELVKRSFVNADIQNDIYRKSVIPRRMAGWIVNQFGDGDLILGFYALVYPGSSEYSKNWWVIDLVKKKFIEEKTPISDYRPLFNLITSYQHTTNPWSWNQNLLYSAYELAIAEAKTQEQLTSVVKSYPLDLEVNRNGNHDSSNPFSWTSRHKFLDLEQINKLIEGANQRWNGLETEVEAVTPEISLSSTNPCNRTWSNWKEFFGKLLSR